MVIALIMGSLAIGFILFFIFGGVVREKELTPEFLIWINQSKQLYGSDNPYVICLFDKTCEGMFTIAIEINPTSNFSEVKDILNKSGKVKSTFGNTVLFETKDIYEAEDFFRNPSLTKISLYSLVPAKINISEKELTSCKIDDDCVAVRSGCCGCGEIVINKNQAANLNSYDSLSCRNTGCAAVVCFPFIANAIKCVDKICKFVNWTEAPCDSRIYSFCKNSIPKSIWNSSNSLDFDYNEPSCNEVVTLCEKNLSQQEIYQRCINETQVPETYIPGYLLMYFDLNATEEEINTFVNQYPLKIKSRLTDYYYEIRNPEFNGNVSFNDFVTYLKSFPNITREIPYADSGYIIAYFYGTVPLSESENIMKNYTYLKDLGSFRPINAESIGTAFVGIGNETDQICKLRDENILYQVGFAPDNRYL